MLVSSNVVSSTDIAQAFNNMAHSISALNQVFTYGFWLSFFSALITFLFPQRASKLVSRLKFMS